MAGPTKPTTLNDADLDVRVAHAFATAAGNRAGIRLKHDRGTSVWVVVTDKGRKDVKVPASATVAAIAALFKAALKGI